MRLMGDGEIAPDVPSASRIDQYFLTTIERWRMILAETLARHHAPVPVSRLRLVVHQTIARLIFLRICEARGITRFGTLRTLVSGSGPAPPACLAPPVEIPTRVVGNLVADLYRPAPDDFPALPADVLGAVYERFLASEFHLSPGPKVNLVEKPERRKSGGVYYTPPTVVRYMVSSALNPLLRGQRPGVRGRVSKMRFLDPACGAGAFLLGVFQHLMDWHAAQYARLAPRTRTRYLRCDEHGHWQLTVAEKKRILLNGIYGVDIDPQAVEVTRLSLLLLVLDRESDDSLASQPPIDPATMLADLREHIRCGDSLFLGIGVSADNRPARRERRFVHRLAWQAAFPAITRTGGFDAVVGNPPYFNVDDVWSKHDPRRTYLKSAYADVYNDKTNILFYFLRLALALSRDTVTMIVSRAFLEAYKADKLRAWLARNARIVEILDFWNYPVFSKVGISTAIVHFRKDGGGQAARVRTVRAGRFALAHLHEEQLASRVDEVRVAQARFSSGPWLFARAGLDRTLHKIDARGQPAGEILHVGQGMQTGRNQAFTVSPAAARGLRGRGVRHFARARNSDIQAFHLRDSGKLLLYVEEAADFGRLPEPVRAHLRSFEDQLRARAAHRRGDCQWWRYAWPLHREYVAAPRILCPYLAGSNRFALDREARFLGLTDTTVLYRGDHREALEYFLGILNSRMMTVRVRYLAKFKGNDTWEYFDNVVSRLPLRRIDFDDPDEVAAHDAIVSTVHILEEAAHAGDQPTLVIGLERLEMAVQRLYGLDETDSQNLDTALGARGTRSAAHREDGRSAD